jgi:hypothetical protein
MPRHVTLLITAVLCSIALAGRGQSANWKKLECDKITVAYPPTWHLAQESRGRQHRYTLTPDSMQRLTMRLVEILEVPVDSAHGFDYFKKNFNLLLKHGDASIKVLKDEETTFKGHKSMYGDIINSSLPQRVYALDAGNRIYVVILTERRYSQIADAGLKRDGNAILNSITFAQ